ncbi:MAG TPA: NMD3-related protein [Sulfolobales archaeon]|nr:NMD3-related protein [Sulfolobales archaeon]
MRFCAKCGRDERSVPIVRHLCIDCYLELRGRDLFPRNITLTYCPSCGSYRIGGEWISSEDMGNDERVAIAYIIESGLKIPEEIVSADLEDLRVVRTDYGEAIDASVRISIGGSQYRVTKRVGLYRERMLCPACHKIRGKGYEAIIQIRGLPSINERLLRIIEENLYNLPEALRNSIAEVEYLREGIDLKLVSRHAAQSIASIIRREFGGRIIETEEGGTGRNTRTGKKPRLVISIRIPSIEEGSYIRINGQPYIVEKVDEEKITLIDREGKKVTMTKSDIVKGWE